jgi:D-arabinose 1-dehydrogenase-like Zn-dependent alcohol dehydrogenase
MTSLPKQYKVASFEKKGDNLTLKDVELKQPERGWILAKVLAVGICHSDLVVQGGEMGSPFPIVPGHEIIGEVVAVGEGDHKGWKVGDRVGGAWHGGRKYTTRPNDSQY